MSCAFVPATGSNRVPSDGHVDRQLAMEVILKKPERGANAPSLSPGENPKAKTDQLDGDANLRRDRFARALAQSAFGRFYWDDRLEAELRRAMTRRKPPRKI